MAPVTADTTRAFVLGLDGVPWYLIERWAANGELPHFAALIEEGAAGPLESTTPATTALAWPSIATGVRPDKHGVYGFQKLSEEYTHRMYTSSDVRQPELWDVLSPALVGNVPMTYPASPITGKLVTGMMTPSLSDRFVHPPEFTAAIRERVPDYRIGLDWSEYAGREGEFTAALADLLGARRELMHLLMAEEDWRLFFFVYTEPDRLQHLLWNDEALLDHYQQLDDVLGEVMAYTDRLGATLYVVSDHGFGPLSTLVSINRLLETEGYLTRRRDSGARGVLSELSVNKSRVMGALERVGIDDDTLVNYLPRSLVDRVASQVPGGHALYDVEYAKTTAFVHGPGTLYINDARRFANGRVDPVDVPQVKADLTAMLSAVRNPETGDRALAVYDGDELFPTDEDSPDLVVRGREEYQTIASITEEIFTDSGAKAASHRSEGIILARGPAIEPGSTPDDAAVYDIAPTLLHVLGEAVPENTDGRVLTELLNPDSEPARRDVKTRAYATGKEGGGTSAADEPEADYGDVEDRLRGLGYLE